MASQPHDGTGPGHAAETRERDVLRELREQMGALRPGPGIGSAREDPAPGRIGAHREGQAERALPTEGLPPEDHPGR